MQIESTGSSEVWVLAVGKKNKSFSNSLTWIKPKPNKGKLGAKKAQAFQEGERKREMRAILTTPSF